MDACLACPAFRIEEDEIMCQRIVAVLVVCGVALWAGWSGAQEKLPVQPKELPKLPPPPAATEVGSSKPGVRFAL
jgi:hypothetical protein